LPPAARVIAVSAPLATTLLAANGGGLGERSGQWPLPVAGAVDDLVPRLKTLLADAKPN